tara:strand:+ start:157 stop:624 length:468 start_codon:yes stop_codon:yes gene_type:complete
VAFNIKATLDAISSHIARTGYVNDVRIGEPVAPPDAVDKMHAAIYMASAGVVSLTLSTTIEVHSVVVRLYRRAAFGQGDDAGQVETEMALAVSQVTSNLVGEFDLGATMRNIDIAGQYGQSLSATWGYITIGNTVFRTVDLTVPLVVDESATQAA